MELPVQPRDLKSQVALSSFLESELLGTCIASFTAAESLEALGAWDENKVPRAAWVGLRWSSRGQ